MTLLESLIFFYLFNINISAHKIYLNKIFMMFFNFCDFICRIIKEEVLHKKYSINKVMKSLIKCTFVNIKVSPKLILTRKYLAYVFIINPNPMFQRMFFLTKHLSYITTVIFSAIYLISEFLIKKI